MAKQTKPVPPGYHTVTPSLVLTDTASAIELYRRALGAEVTAPPMRSPDGKVMHAEIRIGDSVVMLADEMPPMPGMPGEFKSPETAGLATASLFLYVEDCDEWFERARAAGFTVRMEPALMFWGDRYAQVIDPFGVTWSFGTHVEDLSPAEMDRRAREFFSSTRTGETR